MQKSTIDFLKNLKKNNNKEWFGQNRSEYEAAKEDFLNLVNEVLASLVKSDSRYETLKAKDCVFRINRDVRFSNDKSPYKTNMGAAFHQGGKKSGNAAFYFHLEPGGSFAGGGLWSPDSERLKKVRQEIDFHFDAFKKVISHKDFVNAFTSLNQEDKLKNVPKGYDADHPAAEYLKLKSFVAGQSISDKDLADGHAGKIIEKAFRALSPFIGFLNKAIDE